MRWSRLVGGDQQQHVWIDARLRRGGAHVRLRIQHGQPRRVLGMDGDELRRINAIQREGPLDLQPTQDRPTPTHPVMTARPDAVAGRGRTPPSGRSAWWGVESRTRPIYSARDRLCGRGEECLLPLRRRAGELDCDGQPACDGGNPVIECAAAEVGGLRRRSRPNRQSTLGVTRVRIGGASTAMAPAATTDGQQQTADIPGLPSTGPRPRDQEGNFSSLRSRMRSGSTELDIPGRQRGGPCRTAVGVGHRAGGGRQVQRNRTLRPAAPGVWKTSTADDPRHHGLLGEPVRGRCRHRTRDSSGCPDGRRRDVGCVVESHCRHGQVRAVR